MLSNTSLYIACPQQVMVIGDVHGQYLQTLQLINQLEPTFLHDNQTDIDEVVDTFTELIHHNEIDCEYNNVFVFTGDIIDRGPHSLEMLKLLTGITWVGAEGYGRNMLFNTVWGNHEELMYRALGGELEYLECWSRNGGKWFFDLSAQDKKIAELAIERLQRLSGDCLTVNFYDDPNADDLSACVGIVHAECPVDDWTVFKNHRGYRQDALWSRENINLRRSFDTIKNVDLVIAGHTPRDNVVSIGNQRWVNTKKTVGGLLVGLDKETKQLTEHFVGVF